MADFSRNTESRQGPYFIRIQSNDWQVNNKTYTWNPPTDVFENDEYLIVKIEIAGMKNSEIYINIDDSFLNITGTRKESIERRAYRQMEIRFGEFNATVELPKGLALENAKANYDDGFLTITIPRIKATKIQVKG